ncbi:MAG: PilZ domain-containing protein [Gammaproteobacteria bacterium]|nr:PilZ domain-containing protein [Gammaproteobacteria bacterium]MDH5651609.1 PilZ domain-containing protein [Gammaproteobacteria bacterium]
MRSFIRHPSDIPIEYLIEDQPMTGSEPLHDISFGGLSFQSATNLEKGTLVHIRIDTVQPAFEADGVVAWCREEKNHYMVGMEFVNKEDVFLARMVEQICHIEHYKKTVRRNEGRNLTSQEAAAEWIGKFAEIFPNPEPGRST